MLKGVLTIFVIKVALGLFGIGRTLRWMRRRIGEMSVAERIDDNSLDLLEYTVALAAALYPGRAMCLERSLSLLYLGRRAGMPLTYHHGVQPLPFLAHAWVEYDGRVINDETEHVRIFRPFPQVCP